ncbi:MAG: TetR/AcrR family transcriptional regulator [Cellulomonadaceae bacterium]
MASVLTLDRDTIVDTALDITRQHGLSGLTMRALAARFDVTAMALYRHVADREALVRLVVNRVGALVQLAEDPRAAWQAHARAWAVTQRRILRQYPGVAAWLMDNGPAGPEAYRLLDALARALANADFDDETTARGTALIMSWTFSRVSIEDNADGRQAAERPDRAGTFVTGLEQIDPAEYPAAARIGRSFFTLGMEETFDTGLEWILAGLSASAE